MDIIRNLTKAETFLWSNIYEDHSIDFRFFVDYKCTDKGFYSSNKKLSASLSLSCHIDREKCALVLDKFFVEFLMEVYPHEINRIFEMINGKLETTTFKVSPTHFYAGTKKQSQFQLFKIENGNSSLSKILLTLTNDYVDKTQSPAPFSNYDYKKDSKTFSLEKLKDFSPLTVLLPDRISENFELLASPNYADEINLILSLVATNNKPLLSFINEILSLVKLENLEKWIIENQEYKLITNIICYPKYDNINNKKFDLILPPCNNVLIFDAEGYELQDNISKCQLSNILLVGKQKNIGEDFFLEGDLWNM